MNLYPKTLIKTMLIKLFRVTDREEAEAILKSGFIDHTGTYLTEREWSGVWLSNVRLESNEGVIEDTVPEVQIEATEEMLADYEWIEEGKNYCEWLIPATVLNSLVTSKRILL
jgi:hypothetical protein